MLNNSVDKHSDCGGAYGDREINKPPNHITRYYGSVAVQLLFPDSEFALVVFVIQTLKRKNDRVRSNYKPF